jgi:alpha-beta hydrolase superfamily lysophospholipase
MLAILAEGPGQGLTRMRGGMHLSSHTLPAFREFLTQAQEQSIANLGIWGNSFGGLFAALTATSDPRVQAVCINGAPMNQLVPPFRTAREQMDAVFGTAHETELHRQLVALSLGEHDRTDAAMLVLEGGQDPLVPAGSQAAFLALAASGRSELRSWVDGEHTLYNYAQERNAQVADWFSGQLGCEPAGGVLT